MTTLDLPTDSMQFLLLQGTLGWPLIKKGGAGQGDVSPPKAARLQARAKGRASASASARVKDASMRLRDPLPF
jgi:hypothetical protein